MNGRWRKGKKDMEAGTEWKNITDYLKIMYGRVMLIWDWKIGLGGIMKW